MKKIIASSLFVILLFALCGCSRIFKYMDIDNVNYSEKTYTWRIPRGWEMDSPDEYTTKTIMHDDIPLNIRIYDDDINHDFIYVEEDGFLFHNKVSEFPDNNTEDIDYLLLQFIDKTYELKIDDIGIIEEFVSLISDNTETNVNRDKNVASLLIYYKDYPACYFYGNIIIDKQENYWIELGEDFDEYIKLDTNSKILSEVKSVL